MDNRLEKMDFADLVAEDGKSVASLSASRQFRASQNDVT